MNICYRSINFKQSNLDLIEKVNEIIQEYQQMGYDLTLRQVYYQLVARGVIPNNERSYKNLGNLISDGRIAGLISWQAIVDRTRSLRANPHWSTPAEIIETAAQQFALNKWQDQPNYVEVWVEKDALIGVVGQICTRLDVPFFSCRGYVSQSEMWVAAQRLERQVNDDKEIHILHLGDHDPSGRDMSRDIVDRLNIFGVDPIFSRLALNMDQVEQYNPPPNPTKLTDSRCLAYIEEFGHECWELDALRPDVIEGLIRQEVTSLCNLELLRKARQAEERSRSVLHNVAENWEVVALTYMDNEVE